MMIATKLGIKYYKTQDKPVIMELIDKHLEDKLKEETRIAMNNIGGEINLNGITVLSREDGYINATALCKAGGKQFNDWYRLDKTKLFLNALSTSTGHPVDLLTHVITGGRNELRGTWVHPRLAVNIAQWISPLFDVQVSGWVYEIAVTGK